MRLLILIMYFLCSSARGESSLFEQPRTDGEYAFSLLGGVGGFTDVQVPRSFLSKKRADGTGALLDNAKHFGPVFGAEVTRAISSQSSRSSISIRYLKNSSFNGPKDSLMSSLVNIESDYLFHLPDENICFNRCKVYYSFLGRLGENSYLSGVTGHKLRSIKPGAGISYFSKYYKLKGIGYFSIYDQFSYEYGGDKVLFPAADFNHYGLEAEASMKIEGNAWLSLKALGEVSSVKISSIRTYTDAGIYLSEMDQGERSYDLSRSFLRLAFVSYF